MAVLDCHSDDGPRNLFLRPKEPDRLDRLTQRLDGLHPDPGSAAQRLLATLSPVVPIEVARKDRSAGPQVGGNLWAIGLAFARWLLRIGLTAPIRHTGPRVADSPLREQLLEAMSTLEVERMVAIFADSRGRILSQEIVAEGGRSRLRLSLRRVFAKALLRDARRMILAHNHPSGSAEPSENDILSTRRLQAYAHSLGISLDDHLIIGRDSIASMRSLGLL